MKAFCFLLLFIPVSLTAQSFWVQDTVVITRIHQATEIKWIYKYNEKGKITETIYQEMGTKDSILQSKSKKIFSYNEKDSLVLETMCYWRDTHFVPSFQVIYIWNTKLTEELYQYWKDSTWIDRQKTIYTYNRKGKLKNKLVLDIYGDTLYEKKYEKCYSYSFNKERVTFRSSFKREKYIWFIHTYNKQNLIKKDITKKYSSSYSARRDKLKKTWKYNKNNLISRKKDFNKKEFYNYDMNNNLVEKTIQYKGDTLYYKYTYQYDSENNRISTLVQKGKNLEWENSSCIIYKYENNNAVFGEWKVWRNNQWVDGDRDMEIFYDNGKRLANNYGLDFCHQFRGSYKEIKINNE